MAQNPETTPQTPEPQQTPETQTPIGYILKLSKAEYNILRSFLESSTKKSYWHNLPRYQLNSVEYVKSDKWVLRVTMPDKLTRHTIVTLNRFLKVEYFHNEFHVYIHGRKIDVPLHLVALLPDRDIPFVRPINLLDVIEKIDGYRVEAENLLMNKPVELKL